MINDYIRELLEENKKQNLISRQATEEEIREHVEDSEYLRNVIDLKGLRILDIGSGQGFPAIPLAISEPGSNFVLVESDLKKSMFLKDLVLKLGLKNAEVIRARIEELGKNSDFRGCFDMVTCRAVAELPVILEWGIPVLRVNGLLAAWKGIRAGEEIEKSQRALEILGGEVIQVADYEIGGKKRFIVVVKKVKESPPQYPRRGGLAKKRPL
ncbi:MAG: 16S rRNA (guanine(527)-N(7))-methyltransferase RsmG [Syntrophomonadaceae bacterium]|nr:16S rRNA (guanine(527)-N(7))-methyltransferase RsmG [Syntrophomonadaceae bacterium]